MNAYASTSSANQHQAFQIIYASQGKQEIKESRGECWGRESQTHAT